MNKIMYVCVCMRTCTHMYFFRNMLLIFFRAIALVPRLVDAYWHRHCLFLIQNDTTSAMADLDTILTLNRRHTKAHRSK